MSMTTPPKSSIPPSSNHWKTNLSEWSKRLLGRSRAIGEDARDWGARAAEKTRAKTEEAKGRTEAWRLRRERRECCERIGVAFVNHRDAPGIEAAVVAAPEMSTALDRISEIDHRLDELRERTTK